MIKKIEKINPIAKSLRDNLYRKRVIQDKREKQKKKTHEKEIRDGKTPQDS
tara:strand:+ start:577 stop:729 length:153 start_codon:yes stop_codon:yes gene_type:complete